MRIIIEHEGRESYAADLTPTATGFLMDAEGGSDPRQLFDVLAEIMFAITEQARVVCTHCGSDEIERCITTDAGTVAECAACCLS